MRSDFALSVSAILNDKKPLFGHKKFFTVSEMSLKKL